MDRVEQTERQCWVNAQHPHQETIEVIGILLFIRDEDLEDEVCNMFGKIGVNVNECDIHVCHQLREKDRAIIKFANRKDCMNILG